MRVSKRDDSDALLFPLARGKSPIMFILLQLYIVGSIFYIFRSGYPQPADILLALAIGGGFVIFIVRREMHIGGAALAGIVFAFYTFVINMVNFVYLPDKQFILSSLYYVFNVSTFLMIVFLAGRDSKKFFDIVYWGLVVAIILEFLAVNLIETGSIRSIGTFNNPNQLSYWGLLSFSIVIALRYPFRLTKLDYGLVLILLMLSAASLSKGAILSLLFSLCGVACSRMISPMTRYAMVFFVICAVVYAISDFAALTNFALSIQELESIFNRFSDVGGQSDDSLEARGYYRLFHNPEYLLLGAGEGGYSRFAKPYELHSGVATMVFGYGFLGLFLFCTFLYTLFRKLPTMYWILLASVMFYGLTHQNIRFTYFWVFLGVCYWASQRIQFLKGNALQSKTR